jgi:hypothetical protein
MEGKFVLAITELEIKQRFERWHVQIYCMK